jgi:hypothetical protein
MWSKSHQWLLRGTYGKYGDKKTPGPEGSQNCVGTKREIREEGCGDWSLNYRKKKKGLLCPCVWGGERGVEGQGCIKKKQKQKHHRPDGL